MTKTLTEQYYDQILEDGFYYAKNKDMKNTFILEWNPWGQQYQDCEILAPVPSYEEYLILTDFKAIEKEAFDMLINENNKELKEQLKTATYLVRNALSWLEGYYNKDHLVKRHFIVLETLIKRIKEYLENEKE